MTKANNILVMLSIDTECDHDVNGFSSNNKVGGVLTCLVELMQCEFGWHGEAVARRATTLDLNNAFRVS
ncbi:MAG: hypothetical protein AB8B84_04915 [Granulosicoccus sp.]